MIDDLLLKLESINKRIYRFALTLRKMQQFGYAIRCSSFVEQWTSVSPYAHLHTVSIFTISQICPFIQENLEKKVRAWNWPLLYATTSSPRSKKLVANIVGPAPPVPAV